ncbi:hypothetical protein [Bradyrhizobium sp. UFLA06-06]
MKIGDRVEVMAIPDALPEHMGTQALFMKCLGRHFPIVDLKGHLVELEVGEVLGGAKLHALHLDRTGLRPSCLTEEMRKRSRNGNRGRCS